MDTNPRQIDSLLSSLDARLQQLGVQRAPITSAVARLHVDAAAIRFHLQASPHPQLVGIFGGTGTGKSTLLNRLLDAELSASSFMRTFTAGAVAVSADPKSIPQDWLDLPIDVQTTLPARGEPEKLAVVRHDAPMTQKLTLVDTPDVDGDHPAHHQQAERVFRWCDAAIFLVTPEKYQMRELWGYYDLARQYQVPSLFVMNKVDEPGPPEDFARQLGGEQVFVLPRDDSAFSPEEALNLESFRRALLSLSPLDDTARQRGIAARVRHWLGRSTDQVIEPLREQRKTADTIIRAIKAMEARSPGVDVNPLIADLRRRLQQKSIFYLMGPGKMLDRVRQVPALITRLPRNAWDLLRHGKTPHLSGVPDANSNLSPAAKAEAQIKSEMADGFRVLQARIEDAIASSPVAQQWMGEGFAAQKIDPAQASTIAEEELTDLRAWMKAKENDLPRDTRIIRKLLKLIPGGEKVTEFAEAAPYAVFAVNWFTHVTTHGMDLVLTGAFSAISALLSQMSDEVKAKAKATEDRMDARFEKLAHEQILRICAWLDARVPSSRELDSLQQAVHELYDRVKP